MSALFKQFKIEEQARVWCSQNNDALRRKVGLNLMSNWNELSQERQLELREAYGRHLDTLPPTCAPDTKIERFRAWLAQQGIAYDG